MGSFSNLFSINGTVDTGTSVYRNIETLASAANSWVTYDTNSGKWSVIINRPGTSVKSFNDSNIIGSINVVGTGVLERYNSVRVDFPHRDIVDQRDFVIIEIPANEQEPGEILNELSINYDCINDPIQAQVIGLTELKQSRVEKIVQFQTDFTSIGIKAGDLIDITNTAYGWNSKIFRIVKIVESDEGNNLVFSVDAVEYDPNVYDYSDLNRFELTRSSGIFPRKINPAVQQSDDNAQKSDFDRLLGFSSLSALISLLSNVFAPADGSGGGTIPPPQANEDPCGDGPYVLGEIRIVRPSPDGSLLVCNAPIGSFTQDERNVNGLPSFRSSGTTTKLFIEE